MGDVVAFICGPTLYNFGTDTSRY